MTPKNLAKKLKQIRVKAGLSKTAVIRALNYKAPLYPSEITQFERGERQPGMILLLAYAQLGGMSVSVLVDDELSLD